MVAFCFCPNILGDGRDLQMMVLPENECSVSAGDSHGWWGHSIPTPHIKKIELFAL